MFHRYLDALEGIIRTARALRHLSLGCVGELTDYSASLVALLATHQGNSLQTLQIASIKEDPNMYGLIDLPTNSFAIFRSLRVLGLDYDYLTVELLNGFAQNNRAKLERLIVHVHGVEPERASIPNSAWRRVVTYNPNLQVTLNLIHSVDGAAELLDILRPALPLAHLRMFFCEQINVAAVDFISQHNSNTIKSIHIVDGMQEYQINTYEVDTEEDPFVMLAWKCPNLSSFALIGLSQCWGFRGVTHDFYKQYIYTYIYVSGFIKFVATPTQRMIIYVHFLTPVGMYIVMYVHFSITLNPDLSMTMVYSFGLFK